MFFEGVLFILFIEGLVCGVFGFVCVIFNFKGLFGGVFLGRDFLGFRF